ncbi:hypothetical protein M0Q97_02175 [Candidatus Dojkabacteria bacterium]|jgi:hypothetical protein|nr:hypothetical protein [Candidatus Dojkabacteria bacterium]
MEDFDYLDINFLGEDKNDNIITDPLELFMQEIFLAMQTAPFSIWGVTESINISRYVFNKYVTITQIRNEILTFIGKNCAHAKMFNYSLTVDIINSDGKDLVYITMKVIAPTLDKSEQEYIQKFLLGS